MENTCHFDKCAIAKKLELTSPDQCPHFMVTVWTNDNTTKQVHDCVNKRLLLMMMEFSNRMIGVQQAQEQQRNEFAALKDLAQLASAKKRKFLIG